MSILTRHALMIQRKVRNENRKQRIQQIREGKELSFPEAPKGIIVPYNCVPYNRSSVSAPTSVHDVRLPYIDVVAAIGDSITVQCFPFKFKIIY